MLQHLILLLECPLVIAAIFIAGIGGTFQYGFSVSVMTSPSAFVRELVNSTCLQRYHLPLKHWQLSLLWSFTVSVFGLGGLLGSLLASPLVRIGRKKCLLLNNFLAILGAALMLCSREARSFETIIVGRFLYGLNSGLNFSAHTMYVMECAPKRLRTMVAVTVGTFISLGKFSGQLLGISELLGTEARWPWLLGFNGFSALLQLLTLPFLPESPSFLLVDRGDRGACEKALNRLWGKHDHSGYMQEMQEENSAREAERSRSVLELLKDRSLRRPLLTLVFTFTSLQLSGINAVYFYSFEVFRAVGIQEGQLRYAALGTGMCEVFTSLLCFLVIENTGKKVLLLRGYGGMSITLVLLTICLYLQKYVSWMPYCSMVLIFFCIFFFASGPSGATISLPGELFPQAFRTAAFTIAWTINWVHLFLLGMLFPVIVANLRQFSFLVFLFFCAGCGLYIKFYLPEIPGAASPDGAVGFQRIHPESAGTRREEPAEQDLGKTSACLTRF